MLLRSLAGVILLLAWAIPIEADAQGAVADPRVIALRLSDLPPGFAVDEQRTKFEYLPEQIGVLYTVVLVRSTGSVSEGTGPVLIGQQVGRIDVPTSFDRDIENYRQRAIAEDGYQPVTGAPNDGGTATLEKIEGDKVAYQVIFAKRDMLILTFGEGTVGRVRLRDIQDLATLTSGRYDSIIATLPPPARSVVPPQPITAPVPTPSGPSQRELDALARSRCPNLATTEASAAAPYSSPKATAAIFDALLGICNAAADERGAAGVACFERSFGGVARSVVLTGSTLPLDRARARLKSCLA